MTPAELIARNLPALPHPDGTPRQLAGFNPQLLPEALAQQVTETANDIGQAIVHLLETSGYRIVPATQIADPVPAEPPRIANVHCSYCDAQVLRLNISNPNRVMTTQHFTTEKCPQA